MKALEVHIPYLKEFQEWLSSEGITVSVPTEVSRLKSIFVKTLLPHDDFAFILTKKIEMAMTGDIRLGLKEIMIDALALAREDMFYEYNNSDYHTNCRSALITYFKFIAQTNGDSSFGDFSEIWDEYQEYLESLPNDDKCFWELYNDDSFFSGSFGRYYRRVMIEGIEEIGGEVFDEWADADLYCEGDEIASAFRTIKELNPDVLSNQTGKLKLITARMSDKISHINFRALYDSAKPFFDKDTNIQTAIYRHWDSSLTIKVESL